jgi:hypothetical protein
VYTATGQKAKPKVHMSTETTDTGNSSKTPEACGRETEREFVTSNDKPRIVAYRYIIEASIDGNRGAQRCMECSNVTTRSRSEASEQSNMYN